jgi:protein-L-isoaspartate(D-aspartate) O-methyltransferase
MKVIYPVGIKLLLLIFMCLMSTRVEAADWEAARQYMIEEIKVHVIETAGYLGKSKLSDKVLAVMSRVPRHQFVPLSQRLYSYQNRPLAIGYGQTISQPYIVAIMTDLLRPTKDDVVLEVGTGSGYQAAILAGLVKTVYSLEIVPQLAERAAKQLQQAGIQNVETRQGDGYYGWPEAGPFDGIIVTAAGSQIPPPLIEQLKPGGRMMLPVGDSFSVQHLILIEKDAKGRLTTSQILPVRFVPLTGRH